MRRVAEIAAASRRGWRAVGPHVARGRSVSPRVPRGGSLPPLPLSVQAASSAVASTLAPLRGEEVERGGRPSGGAAGVGTAGVVNGSRR